MKVVIIGNHAAGLSAAETLRKLDSACQITVISNEKVPPYSRCLIPYLVSGEKTVEDILFKPVSFYEDNRIDAMLGCEVVRVLPKEKQVLLDSGERVAYEALIVAAGGTCSMPNIPGIEKQGVFGFRTLADAERIAEYCDGVDTAVVLGGGLVGLKAAVALNERGKQVTVAVGSPNVLSQIVAEPEAQVFEEHLTRLGIEIFTRTNPAKVLGDEKVSGIETTEGRKIEAQLVIVGKGVRANTQLVKGTDIQAEHGILIDEHSRTSVPDVYAAGDVTQSPDTVRGETWTNALWPHAIEEGRVAAENVMGRDTVLGGRTSMNSLVLGGLSLITSGLTGAREKLEGAEEITRKGPGKTDCKRFIFQGNRLVGFALVGKVDNAGVLGSLVKKRVDVAQAKERIVAGEYDFASMFPVIRDNREKFKEPEYQEVFGFF
ncbi:MAG: hypothetical protein AMJ81_01270 [Phycisphaerae bacterium SM23_33]|jgi:nitrite reductase (NADH) large subunit|nr:MAG: hypothetical protein AMJ81_01270 [Phycisphaerae bacterium SM23_33]